MGGRVRHGVRDAPAVVLTTGTFLAGVLLGIVIPHLMDAWLTRERRSPAKRRTLMLVTVAAFIFLLLTGSDGIGIDVYAQF